jgi:hypothetical protein
VPRNQAHSHSPQPLITLKELFHQFFDAIPEGNLEHTTLRAMHIHERHLLRILKSTFPVQQLSVQDLQRYVNRREMRTAILDRIGNQVLFPLANQSGTF